MAGLEQSKQVLKQFPGQDVQFLLYLPPGYLENDQKQYPFMLFLHGAGERGSDISKVKLHGPPKLVEEGTEFEFILVSPQCRADQRWNIDRLDKLVTQLTRGYRIDEDRMYLTGLSMGGFGTWNYAAKHPDKWAAIVPICGGGDPEFAERIAHIPAKIFHGAEDEVVPPIRSEEMYRALLEAGAQDITLKNYEGVGHNSWERTYADENIYSWFLKQSKP